MFKVGQRGTHELAVAVTDSFTAGQLEERLHDIETSEDATTIEFGRLEKGKYLKHAFASAKEDQHPMFRKQHANHGKADLLGRVSEILQSLSKPSMTSAQENDRHWQATTLAECRQRLRINREADAGAAATAVPTVAPAVAVTDAEQVSAAALERMPKCDRDHPMFAALRAIVAAGEEPAATEPELAEPTQQEAQAPVQTPRSRPPTRQSAAAPAVDPPAGPSVAATRGLAEAVQGVEQDHYVCVVQ